MKSFQYLILLILLNTLTYSVRSQSYYFDNYSVSEGLYQSRIYDIMQDKDRYLWLGSMGGVSRFDGITFNNYTSQDGLAVNGVQAICQDTSGTIWFGHLGGGISRLKNNVFEVIMASGSIIKNDVIDLEIANNGWIWASTDGSGAIAITNPYDKASKIETQQYKGDKLSDRVFNISKTSSGQLYFITDFGVKRLNESKNNFESYHPDGLSRYWPITYFFEDSRKDQWFGTYHGGIYKYTPSTNTIKVYDIRDGISSNWITYISEDNKGNIWLGSWGKGITLVTDNTFKIFDTSNGLPDDKIDCFFPDYEGNMLIGTNEHGLCLYKGDQIVAYTTKQGIVNPQIWAITQDKMNRMWFGTNGGISVIDPSKSTDKQVISYTETKDAISNQIRFFATDKNDNIWIGSNDQGVMRFDLKRNRFVYDASFNQSYMPSPQVTALVVDSKNILWIGTVDGLVRYNIDKGNAIRLSQVNGLASNEITSLCKNPKGGVWVGSKGKGITFIKDTIFKRYSIGEGITPSNIYADNEGLLWIGTMGQGLFVMKNGKIIKKYTENSGLLSNLVNLIASDNKGFIYIGSNKGLNKIDPSNGNISTYTLRNGFTGIETKNNAVSIDHRGRLWFGTINGAMVYNPTMENNFITEPHTLFTRLRVNLQDKPFIQHSKLSYTDNSLIFNFQGINLSNPEAVTYKIFLKGQDKDWHLHTGQAEVNYSALSPGKYTFMVKARNQNGQWNKNAIEYHFEIQPPFYQTWWFIMVCIFTGSFIIITYIKIREKKLIAEKRILEDKVRERTQEVTQKNEELAYKNKNITDSIRYAKRIQFAILPPVIPFDNAFILFKPKDIVSGDFYWLLRLGNLEFFAAVDCTGHGVPGAFMSIIGHTMLNKIVKEYNIYQPAAILNQLNNELNNTLNKKDESGIIMDGMDIALACYHTDTSVVEFAGAFNSAYLVRQGVLSEIPANRFPVGRSNIQDKVFVNQEFKINKGDCLYLYSDGYADQFGGPLGKKFKTKVMMKLLEQLYPVDIDLQKEQLEEAFETWRGDIEQVDDVLVIGRRF